MKSGVSSAAADTSGRRRLLDLEQLSRTLAFLQAPRTDLNSMMPRADEPEPYCTVCGGQAGIFLGHGAVWHHFRTAGSVIGSVAGSVLGSAAGSVLGAAAGSAPAAAPGPIELYAADHAPRVSWRYAVAMTAEGASRW